MDISVSRDNANGLALAVSSSVFIGSSFIIKKKGLKKAGSTGARAGSGGYSYLKEPWWWAGMITMIVGEIANFAAYGYAPAILVTPLGAEKDIESVTQVWDLATEPGFLVYSSITLALALLLIFKFVQSHGKTHMIVYIGICSLMGSLTVMSVKAVSIAMKLTFSGSNQFGYFQTWIFTLIVVFTCLTQINYLNKALDTFNTAVVSPVYYVMFTSLTILASMIMFKDWASQNASQIASELCGFVTILSGTFLLHKTKDMGNEDSSSPRPVFTNGDQKPESNSR